MAKKQLLPIYEDEVRAAVLARLSRAEGQVRGISRMVEEQRPCAEVLEQLTSVQAALRGVAKSVLRNYMERCVTDAIKSGDTAVYDQLMDVIGKFAR